MKRVIVSLVIIGMLLSFSGCGLLNKSSADNIPLVPALSEKEVVDYYAQSLQYENIVKRNLQYTDTEYEYKEVDETMKIKLENAQKSIEKDLRYNSLPSTSELTVQQHQYIKSIIDDKILIRDSIAKEYQSIDYYFIDVKYKLSPKNTGTLLENVKYLGINGAFRQDNDKSTLDIPFLISIGAITREENIHIPDETEEDTIDNGEGIVDNDENTDDNIGQTNAENNTSSNEAISNRNTTDNVDKYNNKVGGSITQTAYMPSIELVYKYGAEEGDISGYGIYPQGQYALKNFGYDRDKLSGHIILRYVFKSNITDPEKITFITVFPTEMEIDNKIEDKSAIIPQFIDEELKKVVERSDRAISNNDISALASNNIYNDIGIAILNGLYQNNTYLMRHISNINKIMDRKDNIYLVEVETLIQEGPKGSEQYGTYKDTIQMVIQQIETKFVIADLVCVKREIIKEPRLELDDSIVKRLAALGLRGEVSKENKEAIASLLDKLYKASNDRILKDMYDCFNSDTSLLSSTKKEYLNSQLRQWLIKHGAKNVSIYSGKVSEWMGGSYNQAELLVDELIEYDGQDIAQYMQMYYLVSNIHDEWVIDEMKPLEIKDVSGAELEEIKQRIQG